MKNLYYKKEELRKGFKRNLFHYMVIDSNNKRGYNRKIKVYMLSNKDFRPFCIGSADVNTASYKGDRPTACSIVSAIFGYKNDGYKILDERVNLHEIF